MHITLDRMRRVFPDLNLQPHTFTDVELTAKKHRLRIQIEDHPADILGYLATNRTEKQVRKTLVINSRLDEIGRTFVGFHELTHFFAHTPLPSGQWFYARKAAEQTKSKQEKEADAVALVAMIPMWMLCDLEGGQYHDELHPAMLDLYTRRRRIWEQYDI